MGRLSILVFFLVSVSSNITLAEDFPGESSADEMLKGFDVSGGIQQSDDVKVNLDRMHIGGQIQYEVNRYRFTSNEQEEYFQNPIQLGLYLDAKLKNDVRGFFKGKTVFDSTVDETQVSPFGSLGKKTLSSLEELKIQFHNSHKIFWTLGVQKIKWGVGRFWNPSDFLNAEAKDLFKSADDRAGLNLIKMHLPFESSNFYLLANLEQANRTQKMGYGARLEVPLKNSEFSFSHYQRKGDPMRWAGDLSVGIWDFDFIAETAWTPLDKTRYSVFGVSYDLKYNDKDSANISLEGTWNEGGATDKEQYIPIALAGKFRPFQVAQAYQMISVLFLNPGSWTHSAIQFFFARNQTDLSSYYRSSFTWSGMDDLNFGMSLGHREGSLGSEMVLGGIFSDLNLNVSLKF